MAPDVDVGLLDPPAQRVRDHPDLLADPLHCRVQRQILLLLTSLDDQTQRPLSHLRRVIPRCWHDFTLPWNQTVHEPGLVHAPFPGPSRPPRPTSPRPPRVAPDLDVEPPRRVRGRRRPAPGRRPALCARGLGGRAGRHRRDDAGPAPADRRVDPAYARDEGECYETVAAWREAHERCWYANVPGLSIDESTVVVAESFRLVEPYGADPS